MSNYPRLTPMHFSQLDYPDMPLVVLTDHLSSWVSKLIVWHSNLRHHEKHDYSHAMIMIRPGFFASQGAVFKQVPMEGYLGGHRVKLWRRKDWDLPARARIVARVRRQLGEPWRKRRYDALGIVGQWLDSLTGMGRWLNRNDRYYCSERVASHLAEEPILLNHPSPADLDRYFESSPHWEVYGVYDPQQEKEKCNT